jgi:transposase
MASHKKKADKEGLTLVIEDESGFSFVPNRNNTWAPVGETPILRETPGRHNHTCIGYITRTPVRHLLQFRFTTFIGAASFEDFVFELTNIHYYYRSKVLILWDNLPSHHAVDSYFTDERPEWFEFEYFPAYSPELNPVESCWNKMKNDYLPNFVPTTDEELVMAVNSAASRINKEKQLNACFNVAGIPP